MPVSRLRRSALALLASGALLISGVAAATPAASAPPPSKAKPDAGVLAAHLLGQGLNWEQCGWSGIPEEFRDEYVPVLNAVPGIACATITVPRDWHHPTDGNTIQVRISKTGTADPARRQGLIMTNPGGPGGSGIPLAPLMAILAPTVAQEFDFWGMDPRGVGESTPFTCSAATQPETEQQAVEGCLDEPLTPFITTEQTVYDMDFIRALAGEEKLHYHGTSYGTWLGAWYQRVFPHHSGRFVLDSATDLTRKSLEATWDLQPLTRDRQFQDAMLPYLARNAELFGASSSDPQQLRRDWEAGGGTRGMFGQLVTGFFILPAMYNTAEYPMAAAAIAEYIAMGGDAGLEGMDPNVALSTLARKASGNTALSATQRAKLRQVADEPYEPRLAEYMVFEAIRCQDGPWHHSLGYWDAWVRDVQRKAPFIGPMMSTPACAWWPSVTEMPQKLSPKDAPSTLILQSELDAATAYEGGLRSAQQMANTSLVSVDNEGTHGVYPYGTTCVDDKVETYLLTGRLPAKYSVCQAKPLPLETQTFEVGGSIGPKGTIKLKMRTEEVKKANAMLRDLLAEQPR